MTQFKKVIFGLGLVLLAGTTSATASTTYILTVTNGGAMPISPAAIYVKTGQGGIAEVGQAPSTGLIKLCQTGNPATLVQELSTNSGVKAVTQTTAPILPGESRVVEVVVPDPLAQSIHLEAMYGKSKDVCASMTVGSHGLYALKQHVTSDILGKDNVILTGAFLDPIVPMSYQGAACAQTMDAVSCLRELAVANPGRAQIRSFISYLPSVLNFLETKFGSADVLTLGIPSSGAVHFQLKLKH